MDLAFSPEDEAFREEVRGFIDEHFTAEMREKMARTKHSYIDKEDHIKWQKALATKGWLAPNWPVEYGGPGFTPTQKYIFNIEMGRAHTPHVIPFGPTMVAPVIMKFGTDAQKKKFLPDIPGMMSRHDYSTWTNLWDKHRNSLHLSYHCLCFCVRDTFLQRNLCMP